MRSTALSCGIISCMFVSLRKTGSWNAGIPMLCLALSRPIRSRDVEPRNVPLCRSTLCHEEVLLIKNPTFWIESPTCAMYRSFTFLYVSWTLLIYAVPLGSAFLRNECPTLCNVPETCRMFLELCWSTLCHWEMTLRIPLFVSNVPLCAMYHWHFVCLLNFADRRCAIGKWRWEFFFLDWMSHCAQCIVHFPYFLELCWSTPCHGDLLLLLWLSLGCFDFPEMIVPMGCFDFTWVALT